MRKFLKILIWTLTFCGLAFLCGFTRYKYFHSPLKDINLIISRPDESVGFIDYDIERQRIMKICDTVENNQISKIPVDSVIKVMKKIPWAVDVEADINLDKILIVKIKECEPVVRIYNKQNQSVYVDADGIAYPSKLGFTPHVLIGSGNISFKVLKNKSISITDSIYRKTPLHEMFKIMQVIVNDSYSSSCIKQVYYSRPHEYELVMNDSDLRIILGDENDVESKLFRMKMFFKQMQGNPELDKYEKINLNYNKQVVCTKR